MQTQELSSNLRALRLSGILDSLEARNRQAVDGQLSVVSQIDGSLVNLFEGRPAA